MPYARSRTGYILEALAFMPNGVASDKRPHGLFIHAHKVICQSMDALTISAIAFLFIFTLFTLFTLSLLDDERRTDRR